MKHIVTAALFAMTAAAALPASAQIWVRRAPPPPRFERPIPPPSQGMQWTPGHWAWDGAQYQWVAGQWTAPPQQRCRFVQGRWMAVRGQWMWREGGWRCPGQGFQPWGGPGPGQPVMQQQPPPVVVQQQPPPVVVQQPVYPGQPVHPGMHPGMHPGYGAPPSQTVIVQQPPQTVYQQPVPPAYVPGAQPVPQAQPAYPPGYRPGVRVGFPR